MAPRPYKVVIVGGGIAGLSAAHELARRGFAVHVYERRSYYGGKAASTTVGEENPIPSHKRAPRGFPGEHGFRFFPGWYRHVIETMKEIPYQDKTVYDNLVPADVNLLVDYDRDPVATLIRFPTTLAELKTAAAFPAELLRLGLTVDDLEFFLGKLWQFLTSSEERRIREFESQTWWEFMEASGRSRPFQDYLVTAATRNTVAAKPKEASAYTIAKVALRTLFDTLTPQTLFDRVLNGPTSEAWIKPWVDYLCGLGVMFDHDHELDSVEFDGRNIKRLSFLPRGERLRTKVRWRASTLLVERLANRHKDAQKKPAPTTTSTAPVDLATMRLALEEAIDTLANTLPDELASDMPNLGDSFLAKTTADDPVLPPDCWSNVQPAAQHNLDSLWKKPSKEFLQCAQKLAEEAREEHQRALKLLHCSPDDADYFVFSLPVEQMAYYVHRSETMKYLDPSLRKIVPLSEHVDWMAGIQFYLSSVVTITRGHIDLLDSEWSLTAISQTQFWKDIDLRTLGKGALQGKVKSIISVDISAWDRKGRLRNLEAYNCSPQEIAEEVWEQLKRSLNRPGRAEVLSNRMLVGHDRDKENEVPPESYYLDDSIVDRFDRKKQAVYDKARSVRFSADELVRRHQHRGDSTENRFMYGQPLMINAEPLLVNRAGALALRPTVTTQIPNMFLAADYVRTHTDLATMEGANEAARAAVNEILLASGSTARRCDIWPAAEPLEFFRKIDEVLFRRGEKFQDTYADIPIRLVAGAATTTARLAAKALGSVFDAMKRR